MVALCFLCFNSAFYIVTISGTIFFTSGSNYCYDVQL